MNAEQSIIKIKVTKDLTETVNFGLNQKGIEVNEIVPDTHDEESVIFTLAIVSSNTALLFEFLNAFRSNYVKVIEGSELEESIFDFSKVEIRPISKEELEETYREITGTIRVFNILSRYFGQQGTDVLLTIEVIAKIIEVKNVEQLWEAGFYLKGFGEKSLFELKKVLFQILKNSGK